MSSALVRLAPLLEGAAESPLKRWWLDRALGRIIPFNQGHRLSIRTVNREQVSILLPFRRANRNHLGSLHACALATAAEYAAGLLLLRNLAGIECRIIMRELRMSYERQGRGDAVAECRASGVELSGARHRIAGGEVVEITLRSELRDGAGEVLCRGETSWQIRGKNIEVSQ